MQSSVYAIEDPRTARMLMWDSPKRRLLLSIIDLEKNATEVASEDGYTIGKAHYILRDLVSRGLAKVVREEPRNGRAVKYYQATARSFFVPIELVQSTPGAGLAKELRDLLDDALSFSNEEGVLFFVEDGDPRVSWFRIKPGQPVAELWQVLRLTDKDASNLIVEIDAIFDKYQKNAGSEGRVFIIHAAVAPRAAQNGL